MCPLAAYGQWPYPLPLGPRARLLTSLPVNGCRARPYCRKQCIRFLGRLEHTASNVPAHSSRPVLGVPSQFRGPGFRRVGRALPAETPQRNPLLAAPGSGGGGCSPGPAAASLWSSRPVPSVAVSPSPSLPRPFCASSKLGALLTASWENARHAIRGARTSPTRDPSLVHACGGPPPTPM